MELRVLGGTDLAAGHAAAASDLLSQPRPFALLVYLALAEPGRFHRRDALVGLFWAETDQEHARGNLRKLIQALRRSLGDDLLEARGDEELRLAPQALWCDAAECQQCFRSGDLLRVIELYRGPLLPGFVLTGAPGFQSWMELTRRHFSREAVKAALALAENHVARDERTRAGDLARFIEMREPELEDEHQLRKLLSLLHRMGDKTGALRMYEDFRQRLRRDFQAEPAAETRALAEQLRRS